MILKFEGQAGITSATIEERKFIQELIEAELNGIAYVAFMDQLYDGKVNLFDDSIGTHDLIIDLAQYKGQEVKLWISNNPFTTDQLFRLGSSWGEIGKWDIASTYFTEIVRLEDETPGIANDIDVFSGDVEWTSSKARLLYEFGISCSLEQAWDLVYNYLSESARLEPENAKLYHEIGFLYGKKDKWNLAYPYLLKAVNIEPDNTDFLIGFGWACIHKKEWDKAVLYISKALQIEQANTDTQSALAIAVLQVLPGDIEQVLSEKENLPSLLERLNQAIELFHSAMLYAFRAKVCELLDMPEQSATDLALSQKLKQAEKYRATVNLMTRFNAGQKMLGGLFSTGDEEADEFVGFLGQMMMGRFMAERLLEDEDSSEENSG